MVCKFQPRWSLSCDGRKWRTNSGMLSVCEHFQNSFYSRYGTSHKSEHELCSSDMGIKCIASPSLLMPAPLSLDPMTILFASGIFGTVLPRNCQLDVLVLLFQLYSVLTEGTSQQVIWAIGSGYGLRVPISSLRIGRATEIVCGVWNLRRMVKGWWAGALIKQLNIGMWVHLGGIQERERPSLRGGRFHWFVAFPATLWACVFSSQP